jgi:hypothetical protein
MMEGRMRMRGNRRFEIRNLRNGRIWRYSGKAVRPCVKINYRLPMTHDSRLADAGHGFIRYATAFGQFRPRGAENLGKLKRNVKWTREQAELAWPRPNESTPIVAEFKCK